jgi:hypothetical protein
MYLTEKPAFYNKIEYSQTDAITTHRTKSRFILNLDKIFLTKLMKSPKKKFLTLRLFFHPKIFLDLEKMILSNTDRQLVDAYRKSNTVLEGDW